QGWGRSQGDGGLLAQTPRRRRVRVRLHPARHQERPVRKVRTSGLVRRRNVPADAARRWSGLLPEADELPDAPPDLRRTWTLLPGTPDASVRVRDGVPVRKVRCGARSDPGTWLHPGRRAHLLRQGADGRRARLVVDLRARPAA